MKVGDRVRFIPYGCKKEVYGVIKDLHVSLLSGNYIGVRRDDGKEGGSVPGLWLVGVGELAIVMEPSPPALLSRFEAVFDDLDEF